MAITAVTIQNKRVTGNKRVITVDFTMGTTSEAINTQTLGIPLSRVDEVIATSRGAAASYGYTYTTGTTGTLASSAAVATRAEFIGI